MNTAWARFLGALAALSAATLALSLMAGAEPALGLLAAGLLLMVVHHVRNLSAFQHWLKAPKRETLPIGSGAWEPALAELHRHFRSRDESEHAVAGALARFRAAGQALPDGVVILSRERQIEWANPTAERHLDIDARRDAGQAITNLLRNPDFLAYLDSNAYAEPLVLRRARGEAAVLTVRVVAFGDDQVLLLTRDITLEEKLDTMRRDFVANVSHELKTPITVLSGFVETLSDEEMALTAAQKKHFLGLMAEQAHRMQRLIEDLLTLSTLESSNAPPEEQVIDVLPLMESWPRRRGSSPATGTGSRSRRRPPPGWPAAPGRSRARCRTSCRMPCAIRRTTAPSGSAGNCATAPACSASRIPASGSSAATSRD